MKTTTTKQQSTKKIEQELNYIWLWQTQVSKFIVIWEIWSKVLSAGKGVYNVGREQGFLIKKTIL